MDGVEADEGMELASFCDEGGKLKFGASICDAWTQVQKWHKRAGMEARTFPHIHADHSGDRSLMLPVAPRLAPIQWIKLGSPCSVSVCFAVMESMLG